MIQKSSFCLLWLQVWRFSLSAFCTYFVMYHILILIFYLWIFFYFHRGYIESRVLLHFTCLNLFTFYMKIMHSYFRLTSMSAEVFCQGLQWLILSVCVCILCICAYVNVSFVIALLSFRTVPQRCCHLQLDTMTDTYIFGAFLHIYNTVHFLPVSVIIHSWWCFFDCMTRSVSIFIWRKLYETYNRLIAHSWRLCYCMAL